MEVHHYQTPGAGYWAESYSTLVTETSNQNSQKAEQWIDRTIAIMCESKRTLNMFNILWRSEPPDTCSIKFLMLTVSVSGGGKYKQLPSCTCKSAHYHDVWWEEWVVCLKQSSRFSNCNSKCSQRNKISWAITVTWPSLTRSHRLCILKSGCR